MGSSEGVYDKECEKSDECDMGVRDTERMYDSRGGSENMEDPGETDDGICGGGVGGLYGKRQREYR